MPCFADPVHRFISHRKTHEDLSVSIDIKVPTLPESVPDATLLDWKKQLGEQVERDEVLLELETDKVVLEVPAPVSGVLSEILHSTGDTVQADAVLARIDSASAAAVSAPAAETPAAETPAVSAKPPGPAAHKRATEAGLDTTAIRGSGRDHQVTKADVLAELQRAATSAAAPSPSAPPPAASAPLPAADNADGYRAERRERMTRLRTRIAERLVNAQQNAAILTTFNEINMTAVSALRKQYREQFEQRHSVRLGFMSFFVAAAVKALGQWPAVNAYIEDGDIVYHDYCDIGVAVGSPRGLVVPILRNAEDLSFAGIEAAIRRFGEKAKAGTLSIDDMNGGTFTISNGGVFGSLLSTPILNPPQSGILGMHKTEDRAVVENGAIVVRPMMYVALSYDHRIIDGREAVGFLVSIKQSIEDPARLLLDL